MSEEDRALKAARAKALLKKRQQQKAGTSALVSESLVPSRTVTPAPPLQPAPTQQSSGGSAENRDVGNLFAQDRSDSSWLSTLPRAPFPAPPSPAPSHTVHVIPPKVPTGNGVAKSPQTVPADGETAALKIEIASLSSECSSLKESVKHLEDTSANLRDAETRLEEERNRFVTLEKEFQKFRVEKGALLQNEKQTVGLLVSEKASLISELQRLERIEFEVQGTTAALEKGHIQVQTLEARVQALDLESAEATKRAQHAETMAKELAERHRDQERQLQLANVTINELREEASQHRQKARELQEQISNDDRVEKLEVSLKNTQNRADELEFQLSKLTQTHTILKAEHDKASIESEGFRVQVSECEQKYDNIRRQHEETLKQMERSSSDLHEISESKTRLESEVGVLQKDQKNILEKLRVASSELGLGKKQVLTMQQDLKNANRRAEEAEKTQRDLQTEGTTLMRSLDEMRPKVVELTSIKAELTEKVDGLQHIIRNRDSTISQLEGEIEDLRDAKKTSESGLEKRYAIQSKELVEAISGASELQKAYGELKDELDNALVSLHALETERSNHHQEAIRRLEEIERLTNLSRSQSQDLDRLRQELDEQTQEREEDQELIDHVQTEMETLRAELSSKEEEIRRLRQAIPSPIQSDAPQSLDTELLSSLKQQHALELSAAQSQIRALENSVYGAQSQIHALQRQVSALEDQLTHARSIPRRSFSPGLPSRPSSRGQNHSDMRRSSFGSHRPSQLSRSSLDQNLSAEILHKRKISLSMLKARMESEAATKSRPITRSATPIPPSLEQVQESNGYVSTSATPSLLITNHPHSHYPRTQFMDEAHIFWCNACRGDLVIL